jgi:predicted O-methyltransferase YrrM
MAIDRLRKESKVVSRMDNSVHEIFPIAISLAEGEALSTRVTRERAARTIEIGLAYGISALFICEGLLKNDLPNSKHVVIDPFQATGFKNCGLQVLDEAGVTPLIEFLAEESQIVLPRLVSEGQSFEFAFVDGSHLFDRVFLDLIYLGRLVRPGGVIFVDDYQAAAIARAVSFCLKNLEWTLEDVSLFDAYHQWAVLRTPRAPIERKFPHFVDF